MGGKENRCFFLMFIILFFRGMKKENEICRNQVRRVKVPFVMILIGAVYWSIQWYRKEYKFSKVLCPQFISGMIIGPLFLDAVIHLLY